MSVSIQLKYYYHNNHGGHHAGFGYECPCKFWVFLHHLGFHYSTCLLQSVFSTSCSRGHRSITESDICYCYNRLWEIGACAGSSRPAVHQRVSRSAAIPKMGDPLQHDASTHRFAFTRQLQTGILSPFYILNQSSRTPDHTPMTGMRFGQYLWRYLVDKQQAFGVQCCSA